ncbi:MAG: TetR/AcrR family transcriptional regulator [Thermoleophilaceae bacterium]
MGAPKETSLSEPEIGPEIPLRARKKLRTRKAISDAATDLFAERGFDAVTVEDVAEAAEVSKKTVFNYFGCKEDLLFDEADAAKERLVAAVRERDPGESVLAAVRRNALAGTERMCSGEAPWIEKMSRLVAASPSLQTREREIYDDIARALAEVIREETGADEGDCRPYVAARAMVGVQRSVIESARRRVVGGGQTGAELAKALRREVERGFAVLEEGLAH